MTQLGLLQDTIPVVANSTERGVRFPSPLPNQRVQNLDTGNIERWTNGSWTPEYLLSAGGTFNVKTYGAVGDDSTDDTAALQAAITAAGAGGCLIFPEGIYRCVGLTSSANAQKWIGYGQVILKKNGNGVILAHDGDDFYAENIQWRGDASTPVYTGNNLNLTGDNPKLVMCGSRYAYARAVLATGNHVQILGTNDIYQTTDATGTGYDIEVGISGTATLYHQIQGVYTSQATGGIKFIDCGSQSVVGGQFGKYTVAAGTSPAGVNGGLLVGARVLGNIAIDISNSTVVGNQFGAVTFAYGSGTSGHRYLGNVEQSGFTMTNAGNLSADIVRQIGTGGTVEMKYGADASLAILKAVTTSGMFTFPSVRVPNAASYWFRNFADDADGGRVTMTASDVLQLVNLVSGGAVQLLATAGKVQLGTVAAGVRTAVSINGLELLSLTAAERDALTGVTEGTLIFNDDTNKLNFYTGAGWEAVTSA